MAKLAVTVTVFFFLIALSHARIPVDLTEHDVTNRDLSTDSTESDPKTTANLIFLPSDRPESESEEVVVKEAVNEIQPEKTERDSSESKTTTTTTFEPLTVINFRPITRQFPRRPSLVFRHRRPCRHHATRKPWVPFQNRELPYGNDMLTLSDATGHNKAERPRLFRGDEQVKVHQIPARWVNFHDGDAPRFPFRHEDDVVVMKKEEEEDFKRPRHDHHGHHHHHHRHHDEEEEEREGHEHGGGLLRKIRKFLTHF